MILSNSLTLAKLSWIPSHFAQNKKLHSFILTQLDDGSHLEFYHVEFSHYLLWIQTPCFLLSDFTQKNSHSTLTLTQTNSIWLKLDDRSVILNSAMMDSAILHKTLTQTVSIWLSLIHAHSMGFMTAIVESWPSQIQPSKYFLSNSLTLWLKTNSHHLHSKTSFNLILTQLDDGSHLEFCHLKFGHYPFGFSHHSYLLLKLTHTCQDWSLYSDSDYKLIHSDSNSFILTQLDDGSHLEFCKRLIQPLPSWIQTPCYLLLDSLKNTLTPLWLWLKLIQSDSNSFNLI